MTGRFVARLLLVVVALAGPAPAVAQGADEPFFFLHLADPQLGMFTADADFAQETANFEFVVATANRLRPAFVVVTGDLVNRPGDAAQIAEYRRIAARLDPSIPLYNVAGNHDVGNEPTAESVAAYRERFGPDYYAFRHGRLTGIVLDSVVIHSPGNVPELLAEQEAWLRQELARAAAEGQQIVVFQHHSWFLDAPDEEDQYFNIPRERRDAYLALFAEFGVTHVFAGHYHRNASGRAGDLEMVTSGPVGMPLGEAQSGIRIAVVRGGTIEHRYYALGEIPSAVALEEAAVGAASRP